MLLLVTHGHFDQLEEKSDGGSGGGGGGGFGGGLGDGGGGGGGGGDGGWLEHSTPTSEP